MSGRKGKAQDAKPMPAGQPPEAAAAKPEKGAETKPAEVAIPLSVVASKQDQAQAVMTEQLGALIGAHFKTAYASFKAAFMDFVEANPGAPGRKFKFPISLTATLSPMEGDVALHCKLGFGRRRSFATEPRPVSAPPPELFDRKP